MKRIRMHDWDTWQSYRNDRGTPPWVKVHRSLLSNQKWAELSDAEKGQLISMWIVAADSDGYLPNDVKTIRKICQLDENPNLEKLIELQWVDVTGSQRDAKLTPTRRQVDAPETETETDPPYPPRGGRGGFDEVVKLYSKLPGSVPNVTRAEKLWLSMKLEQSADKIIKSIGEYALTPQWKDRHILPNLANFLAEGQWKISPILPYGAKSGIR